MKLKSGKDTRSEIKIDSGIIDAELKLMLLLLTGRDFGGLYGSPEGTVRLWLSGQISKSDLKYFVQDLRSGGVYFIYIFI